MFMECRTSTFRRFDPGTIDPRRLVAHMLWVAAFQLGHPVAMLVYVKSDDLLSHARLRVRIRGSPSLSARQNFEQR